MLVNSKNKFHRIPYFIKFRTVFVLASARTRKFKHKHIILFCQNYRIKPLFPRLPPPPSIWQRFGQECNGQAYWSHWSPFAIWSSPIFVAVQSLSLFFCLRKLSVHLVLSISVSPSPPFSISFSRSLSLIVSHALSLSETCTNALPLLLSSTPHPSMFSKLLTLYAFTTLFSAPSFFHVLSSSIIFPFSRFLSVHPYISLAHSYSNTCKHTHTHTHTHTVAKFSHNHPRTGSISHERHISQHTATHCNTLQRIVTHCNTLQHTATHCNTLQHTATHCNTLQHTAKLCNTLQYTATHCNTLQHTTTHCNTL